MHNVVLNQQNPLHTSMVRFVYMDLAVSYGVSYRTFLLYLFDTLIFF